MNKVYEFAMTCSNGFTRNEIDERALAAARREGEAGYFNVNYVEITNSTYDIVNDKITYYVAAYGDYAKANAETETPKTPTYRRYYNIALFFTIIEANKFIQDKMNEKDSTGHNSLGEHFELISMATQGNSILIAYKALGEVV